MAIVNARKGCEEGPRTSSLSEVQNGRRGVGKKGSLKNGKEQEKSKGKRAKTIGGGW